eukprot:11843388-Karenia_brevis.AAC.1
MGPHCEKSITPAKVTSAMLHASVRSTSMRSAASKSRVHLQRLCCSRLLVSAHTNCRRPSLDAAPIRPYGSSATGVTDGP